ncbi:hypothetical protein O181_002989 [Austropuccinia psidii MF-1]|uniref:Uncharacterized protein n=1 Tax=Austropuccinia psidii MF-1 TaxID=1389203 RepID=A0A9Q3BDB2_9BASI|nr:hypothetical protein [Austropuccinia psidii MF-1]
MLGWQTGPPRGMELCSMGIIEYFFVKEKSKRFKNKVILRSKGSFEFKNKRISPDSKNLEDPHNDRRLSTIDEDRKDGEITEELQKWQILETQEPEQGPSLEIISNHLQDEQEKKKLSWYLEKAIKENKEWATSEPKK